MEEDILEMIVEKSRFAQSQILRAKLAKEIADNFTRFVEWLAFKSHGNFNPRFELHKYWDGTVNEWKSVFRKLDGLIWEDITIAELYNYWQTEIRATKNL